MPDIHGTPDGDAEAKIDGAQGTGTAASPNQSDGSPKGPDIFAGSSYGADQNVGGTDAAGFLKDADPRDFLYGRDPNYAANTAAAERTQANTLGNDLYNQGQAAQTAGSALDTNITNYGQNAAIAGQQGANTLTNSAGVVAGLAAAAGGRQGPQANYNNSNAIQGEASDNAYALSGMPVANGYTSQLAQLNPGSVASGAQAQLQSGLNASEASNLALARSGHGWGASASAQNQAIQQNAAAGQQASNQAAMLKAQEGQFAQTQQAQNLSTAGQLQNAQNAQQASNLANAGQLQATLGTQYGQQALSNAQLQAQTTQTNDQAQANLYGLSLGAQNNALQNYNNASQLGLQGTETGAQYGMSGATLGMQATQGAMGIYGQGESLAGMNMSSEQSSDLARENQLEQTLGINQGVSIANQNATNSAWGTGLSAGAAVVGSGLQYLSDASAKTDIKPLDGAGAPPTAQQPLPSVNGSAATGLAGSAGSLAGGVAGSAVLPGVGGALGGAAGGLAGKSIANASSNVAQTQPQKQAALTQNISQAAGAGIGGAIGSVIAPGVGTALGGIAGSVAGTAIGKLISSDISTKDDISPMDATTADANGGMGMYGTSPTVAPSGALGYGSANPSGSTQAGAANAFSGLRGASMSAANSAEAKADLADASRHAAATSMLTDAIKNDAGMFGANSGGMASYNQFAAMGRPQQMYGQQPVNWSSGMQAPGMITSDEHSKTKIRSLATENAALRNALTAPSAKIAYPPAPPAPTQSMLNQAAADQAGPGGQIAYPPSVDTTAPPSMDMLNQAAATQYQASDARSKRKISELSSQLDDAYAALGSGRAAAPALNAPDYDSLDTAYRRREGGEPVEAAASATEYPTVTAPNYDALDEAYRRQQSPALDMVDAAPGYSYEYKDPARHGYGQKFGPMAQDLLKTPAGASTVEQTPDGTLAVNTGRLALAQHAALHSMHRETRDKFAQLKGEIDALKGGKYASNDGSEGGSGMNDEPARAVVPVAPNESGPSWWDQLWSEPERPLLPKYPYHSVFTYGAS